MSCQAFYFQTEQPDLVVELITYYTRKIKPDVEKLRTKPQPSYLVGVVAEEPCENWYQWYTYHDNSTPEFASDLECLCKIKNILGEVIQFHSTAGEHIPVGFGFKGIDYCSKWNDYNVCDEDKDIQEAFALRIESPRWKNADDRNLDKSILNPTEVKSPVIDFSEPVPNKTSRTLNLLLNFYNKIGIQRSGKCSNTLDTSLDNTERDKEELERLREFYKNIYWYVGTYPNWKVQQEYRHLLTTFIACDPTPDRYVPYHLYNIDTYLTRLSLESRRLSYLYPELRNRNIETDAEFEIARGCNFLDEIRIIHANTIASDEVSDARTEASRKY